MRQPTAEIFLKDTAEHKMTVALDQGLYRHVKFRQPTNGWNMWFEIITWPNCLTINGDMGSWAFSRLEDMFTFFRSKKLSINASYWAEKVKGGVYGGRESARVYDPELFGERLLDQLENYYSLEGSELSEVSQAVKDEVLSQDCKHDLMIKARDFTFKLADGTTFQFDSCELPDGKDYSYHFIWCLYAIVWAIQQWDALHDASAPTEDVPK
jgi:hypothetical protein